VTANYFFDTSALVKLYHREDGSEKAEEIFNESDSLVFVSEMGTVEIHSALVKKVRVKELSKDEMDKALQSFYDDCVNERIRVVPMEPVYYQKAIVSLIEFGVRNNLRTLDAIQLSVASAFSERRELTYFVCADPVLCHIAQIAGLEVINPAIK